MLVVAFILLGVGVGCTETVLTRRGRFLPEPLPRPDRVVVYDFDASHADVTLDPSIAKEIARGRIPRADARRQVALAAADLLAAALVEEILALGMPAERGRGAPVPKQGALIVDGQILRVDEGSRAMRSAVGFGAGRSELRTLLHVDHVTAHGRRRIGEFETATRAPEEANAGNAVVAAVEETNGASDRSSLVVDAEQTAKSAGDVLAELFVRQGWISNPSQ